MKNAIKKKSYFINNFKICFISKVILFFCAFLLTGLCTSAQDKNDNIVYVVDSVPVIDDPADGNEISNEDIESLTVVKNIDSLKSLGYEKYDGAIFVFTKEYSKRPDSLKQIPTTIRMQKLSGLWTYNGLPYTGRFIDYFYSGRKEGEGFLKNGKINGLRKTYFQNGKLFVERFYENGIENGFEKEYFKDGSLKQKGLFVNGKEDGVWEMYFPNGQVKQSSFFKNGMMDSINKVYYSSGKLLATEIISKGKAMADPIHEKQQSLMNKGHENSKDGDYKAAIKNYTKAIEIDKECAEAFFARGTAKLNDFQFDDAIADLDEALKLEPYLETALANRAFTRIRKYEFAGSRELMKNNSVTVLTSKDKPNMPENEKLLICSDLEQAVFLGDDVKMVKEAVSKFCTTK